MKQPALTLLYAIVGITSLSIIACNRSRDAETPPYRPAAIDAHPNTEYLSPEASMRTMHLPEGYHLELVASEPVIQEPVAITWDGNGRICESVRSWAIDDSR